MSSVNQAASSCDAPLRADMLHNRNCDRVRYKAIQAVRLRRSARVWLLAAAVLPILGCGAKDPPAAGQGSGAQAKPAVKQVSGALLTVEALPWPVIARVQGSLSADEVSTIAARVTGRIVEVNCDLGDTVAQDQPLVKLDDTEYSLKVIQAEAQLAQVRAAIGLKTGDPVSNLEPLKSPPVRETKALLDEARQQVARLTTLFEQRAIVATDLEAAQSAEQVADARFNSSLNSVREKMALVEVQAAQLELARQQLSDTVVVAPLEGMVLNRYVAVGTYVQVGQPIVELAKTSPLRYRASVPERYAQRLQVGQRVRVTVQGQLCETTVSRISPALDPLNRALVFESLIPNSEHTLRSGLFAQAEIVLDEQSTAIAVPTTAVVRFAGVDKAWRVVAGQVSEAPLQVGREVDGKLEILDGLNLGDHILLNADSGRSGEYIGDAPSPGSSLTTY